jgi:flagellar biosynthesis regulator FlbT
LIVATMGAFARVDRRASLELLDDDFFQNITVIWCEE